MIGMALKRIPHRRPIRSGKHSTFGEKSAEQAHAVFANIFGGRIIVKLIIGTILVLILITAGLWMKLVYANPEHVFWTAINNSLSSVSVTKDLTQSAGTAKTNIITQLAFGHDPIVKSIKNVDQQLAQGSAHITVETIGTPSNTYQHYTNIKQTGKNINYDSVYNLWVKDSSATPYQFFNDAVFGAMLFGKIPAQDKQKIIDYLREAYKINFNLTKKDNIGGRKIYTYEVSIALQNYSKAAKIYAQTLGMPNADKVSPSNYKATDKLNVTFVVDVYSRQVKSITYTSTGAKEKYSGYGILSEPKIPSKTVDYSVLEKALQESAKQN
jgi:hypothetical protein